MERVHADTVILMMIPMVRSVEKPFRHMRKPRLDTNRCSASQVATANTITTAGISCKWVNIVNSIPEYDCAYYLVADTAFRDIETKGSALRRQDVRRWLRTPNHRF